MLGQKARSLPKTWKETLKLPRSTFPPRGPSVTERAKLLQKCTDDLYAWQSANRISNEFVLHDGPPYANGDLHIGHALNKILKDVTCRFQLSQGRRVNYVPGWDCHGLPIELKALEQQKIGGKELSSNEVTEGEGLDSKQIEAPGIRQAAKKLAERTVERQKAQFREWGIMANWDRAWKTMDRDFEIKQLEVFKRMVTRGLIYRRFKPVYWSPSTRTALAEAELEYHDDHVSTAAFVKFPLRSVANGLKERLGIDYSNISFVIWTTQPWTLPANKAIGFNPNIEYAIVSSLNHGKLLIARSRIREVEKQCEEQLGELLIIRGSELAEATYEDALWSRAKKLRRLFPADHVTADAGSGLAHIAPGHGPDDYKLCQTYDIAPFAPVDEGGAFDSTAYPEDPSFLLGKYVLDEGNKTVLERMKRQGTLLAEHKFTHKYPYDWRSKKPVILRATEQWFANVGNIKEAALQSLDYVNFVPQSGRKRLESFIRNRNEWCISRQRAWGVPVPALYHEVTGDVLLTEASVNWIISMMKERGSDAWWRDNALDPVWTPPELRGANGHTQWRRGKDTMDVWFDSGTSWTQTSTEKDGDPHVADVYLEGSDQHRGWFQSSLLTYISKQSPSNMSSSARPPFRNLVTHGFVLDQHGRKMSKSEGNVISPQQIMDGSLLPPLRKKINGQTVELKDAMGPDALRLWVSSSDFTTDVVISPEALKTVNNNLSKYRTTFKQILGIVGDSNMASSFASTEFATNHKIAFLQLQEMASAVTTYFADFDYHKAVAEINRYISADLSSFYFETCKDAAYCGTQEERANTQAVMRHILHTLQLVLAPVTPLLVQETWDHMPEGLRDPSYESAFTSFRSRDALQNSDILSQHERVRMEKDEPHLMAIVAAVQKTQEQARSRKKMGSSLQSDVMLEISGESCNEESQAASLLSRYNHDLATILVVSKAQLVSGTVTLPSPEWHFTNELKLLEKKVVVHVYAPQEQKCVRCWRYLAPVSKSAEEALCSRCEKIVDEIRLRRPELFDLVEVAAAAA